MKQEEQDKLLEAIETVESYIDNPKVGLPQSVFYFVTRLTPMVNVDLLIKDQNNRVLLAWRQDQFAGAGWHIPGGIIRYKETIENRIQEVARNEIGCEVSFDPKPLVTNQIHRTHDTRGHFISFLYNCTIDESFIPDNSDLDKTDPGYLVWHDECPDNLIEVHELYRPFI
jgi:colanic acid biosynthesis protein WcaH